MVNKAKALLQKIEIRISIFKSTRRLEYRNLVHQHDYHENRKSTQQCRDVPEVESSLFVGKSPANGQKSPLMYNQATPASSYLLLLTRRKRRWRIDAGDATVQVDNIVGEPSNDRSKHRGKHHQRGILDALGSVVGILHRGLQDGVSAVVIQHDPIRDDLAAPIECDECCLE